MHTLKKKICTFFINTYFFGGQLKPERPYLGVNIHLGNLGIGLKPFFCLNDRSSNPYLHP